MEQINKLYKCYKPGCNKAEDSENPFLTQSEYDELIKDGQLICPEFHEVCGIRELKPEDYPKQPKDKKKFFLLGGAVLILLLVIGGVFAYINSQKNKAKTVLESVETISQDSTLPVMNDEVTQLLKESERLLEDKKYEQAKNVYLAILALDPDNIHANQGLLEIDKIVVISYKTETGKKQARVESEPVKTQAKTTKTLRFDFGYYKGDVVNNLMHGFGTLYFEQGKLISSKDPKKRFAEAGDFISGTWFEGYLDQGKWFNKSGEQKGHIIIGH